MFTAQEFNENLKKKRMGDFSYNLEKTKDYIIVLTIDFNIQYYFIFIICGSFSTCGSWGESNTVNDYKNLLPFNLKK